MWLNIFLFLFLTLISALLVGILLEWKYPVTDADAPNGSTWLSPRAMVPIVFFLLLYGYIFKDSIQACFQIASRYFGV